MVSRIHLRILYFLNGIFVFFTRKSHKESDENSLKISVIHTFEYPPPHKKLNIYMYIYIKYISRSWQKVKNNSTKAIGQYAVCKYSNIYINVKKFDRCEKLGIYIHIFMLIQWGPHSTTHLWGGKSSFKFTTHMLHKFWNLIGTATILHWKNRRRKECILYIRSFFSGSDLVGGKKII